MKNKNKLNSSDARQVSAFRLSGDKILLGFFACLSLAFVLFYTFGQNTTQASSNDSRKAPPVSSVEKTVSADSASSRPETAATVSNVVTKALAFKALLTTTQQATLEKTYTTTLA